MIESPYAGQVTRNVAYARACLLDSLRRGEAPFAMHLLFPQVLDDKNAEERALGIAAGLAWSERAELVALYVDLGISGGMRLAVEAAERRGIPVEHRSGIWNVDAICQVCWGAGTHPVERQRCLYCTESAA